MLKRIRTLRDKRSTRQCQRRVLVGVVLACASCMLLAGCGASAGAANGSHGAATATATQGRPGVGKLTVRGCPGPFGTSTDAGSPRLVLTNQTKSGDAHVGDLVQVQVPATYRWSQVDASSNLALQQPAGVQDSAKNVCVWTYRALSAGAATVQLTGGALCEPTQPCPAYAVVADFSISVN